MKNIGEMIRGLPEPYREINFFYRSKGWTMDMHEHPWHQLTLVTEGVLQLYDENGSYLMQKGQLCLIPRGYKHALATESGYYEFGITIGPVKDHRGMTALMDAYVQQMMIMNRMDALELLPAIRQACGQLTTVSKLKVAGYLDSLLISCVESTFKDSEIDFRNKLTGYLRDHIADKVTLKQLCSYLAVSQSHLERLTFQEFGCGVIELYNQMRMNQACSYLTNSDLSLAQISEQLGFFDQSHFSNFFKRKMNMSPSAYKKLMIEKWQ